MRRKIPRRPCLFRRIGGARLLAVPPASLHRRVSRLVSHFVRPLMTRLLKRFVRRLSKHFAASNCVRLRDGASKCVTSARQMCIIPKMCNMTCNKNK